MPTTAAPPAGTPAAPGSSTPAAPPATPTPPAPPAPAPPPGLTPDQLQELHAARRNGRKVARAARAASFSGWTLATFAGITLLAGIFSLSSFVLGVGMAIVAWIELRGASGIRQLDVTAPRRLAFNQLGLGAMMCAYAGWGVYATLTGPSVYAAEMAAAGPQVAAILGPIDQMQTTIMLAVYIGVGCGALAATGGAAIYYLTRRRHIETHLQRTPAWVVEAIRSVG